MTSEDSFLVLVHYRMSIKKKTCFGIKFTDKDLLSIFLKPTTSFAEFLNSIIQKLGLQDVKRVENFVNNMKYDSFVIESDEELEVLFHCHLKFLEVRTLELLAKLVDVVSNSRGSNRNSQALTTAACSSSRPVGTSSFVPVITPEAMVVASPSFVADINRSGDGEVGITDTAPVSLQDGPPRPSHLRPDVELYKDNTRCKSKQVVSNY
ncbi:hypothetical protein Ahy_A05g022408 [Arachis hypogaea]|uniref:Uncharacterized protein n=1 Tax=Arachis hypogaea TaxID=3818 RepID=A0A445D0H0_ARAHY|nr:hypothetical protein Ahy_A05g022408 [Arachis hypogaea]